jgi:hypothetical protein
MSSVGFEATNLVFKRTKKVHVFDLEATVTGLINMN